METSYLKTLELDKIIARASEGCVCKEAREQLLALEPQCDPDEVRYALEQTDAINSSSPMESTPPLTARAARELTPSTPPKRGDPFLMSRLLMASVCSSA